MEDKIPIRQPSLADQVLEILIERITSGTYQPGELLPTENHFADLFNVSRSTIRTAFSRLEERKLIQRRHGVGTFVSGLLHISNPLNQFIEFPKLIEENGFEPGFRQLSADIITPDMEIRDKLALEPGENVLRINKLFTADGDPIIYVINLIPSWVYDGKVDPQDLNKPSLTNPFIDFFEQVCQQPVSHFVSTVRPDVFVNIEAPEELIHDGPYTPVLVIEGIGYNHENRPIVSSSEYHPGGWMNFKLVRRRSGF